MRHKVQARKSRVQDVKPAVLAVAVRDQKLLTLYKLIKNRKCITRKIKRLPKLEPRFKVENPELSLQQLFDRLQKKKATIDRGIAKYHGVSIPKRPAQSVPTQFPIHFSKEHRLVTMENLPAAQLPALPSKYSDILDWFLKQQATCTTIRGAARPYLTQIGATIPGLNDLNHNSSADYVVDQQSYLTGSLGYLIGAWLNDDASTWRDDNPDSVMWYDNVCMFLPAPDCDSNISASLSIRFSGQITSEADDHNEIRQYVYVAHSDENGNLPPYVSFGDEYNLNNLDLSGEIGLPSGNRFDSGWVTAAMSFNVKAGVTSTVAIANCTELSAQDGILNIIGTWEITDLYYTVTFI